MRNLITLLALVISVTGIGVSLAREELRCYIGLEANNCQSNTVKEPPSSPEKVIIRVREIIQPSPTQNPETTAEETETPPQTPIEETQETASSNPPPALEDTSQPIEVIPPPEDTSQPIEVIPPLVETRD